VTVECLISNWRHFFNMCWMDFNHLAILSFHKSNGNWINNTTAARHPGILLLVINGPVNACRKQDIKFVRVQCSINFASLVMINPYPINMVLRATYYIQLPQGTQGLLNGNSVNYNLESFGGVKDLCTSTVSQVQNDILGQVQQDTLVLLTALDFNLHTAPTPMRPI
jgi:hypothetical protein